MAVYDLIECIVAVFAGEEREKDDKERFVLFKKAIVGNGDEKALKEYCTQIRDYIEFEQEEYQKAVKIVQDRCKINSHVMDGTISEQMETEDQIVLYGN